VVHTASAEVLVLERADRPGFWQSVTGSRKIDEILEETAKRELLEETGLDVSSGKLRDSGNENIFEIVEPWRSRYDPAVTHNTERVFYFELPRRMDVSISREHLRYEWLARNEAADRVFSHTNRAAIIEMEGRPGT